MHVWELFLAMMALLALAGCATPDPGTSFDCPLLSDASTGCYAGAVLVADPQLLEKAARDYCTAHGEDACNLLIWSAPAGTPLPPGQVRSDLPLASYRLDHAEGLDCFVTYASGMIDYASEGCPAE
jgi:hypothetical protein